MTSQGLLWLLYYYNIFMAVMFCHVKRNTILFNLLLVGDSKSVNGNGISALAIVKKGHNFINIDHMEKSQITAPPPQSLGLRFSKCRWIWNISIGHYKKIEKWLPFHKYRSYGKFSNNLPLKICI